MDWESGVFFVSGGDIGWQNRRIGKEGLKDLVLDMPEPMWLLALSSRLQVARGG